jgi:hypothetical protein
MFAMLRKPIGVWFSIALVILILGVGLGWKVGQKLAVSWYRSHPQRSGTLSPTEQARVHSIISALSAVQISGVYAGLANDTNDPKVRETILRADIEHLRGLSARPELAEIKPVIELHLGIAHAIAATIEEQHAGENAAVQDMQSAQALFQSLGWQDCSEETLKTVAERELARWHPDLAAKAAPK